MIITRTSEISKTMDKIGVLTYIEPHRKTYDTLVYLKSKGYNNVVVFSNPKRYTKNFKPIYEHRPKEWHDLKTETLCKNFGYEYIEGYPNKGNLRLNSIVIICGAGIIEEAIVEKYRIINSHPSILPLNKGLDAFKWTIYNKDPLGVTSHLITKKIDDGPIILQKKIEIHENDTFHSVAFKIFELEIKILVDSIDNLNSLKFISAESISPRVNRRMPKRLEKDLMHYFQEYKNLFVVDSDQ
jgi:phosphoribosylglycinamide formyltransferase-1